MRFLRVLALLAISLPVFADDLSDALAKALAQTKQAPASARGDALYGDKKYEEAASAYLEYVTSHPDDSNAWYNLSCCLALLKRKDDAIAALDQAVKAGFTDVTHIKADPDLEVIRKKKAYKAIVKSLSAEAGAKPKTEWIPANALLPCYIAKPKGFDSKKEYGLLLLLHGRGDTADHFLGNVADWGGDDFIVAAVETPYVLGLPGGRAGRCWAPWESGKENTATAYKLSADTVGRTLDALKKSYKLDPKRVFVLGFSEGAFMSAHCALLLADKIAGAIVISGGYDPSLVTDADFAKAKGLRILVAHGTSDSTVPFGSGKKLKEALDSHGVPVEFFPFEGGHQIPKTVRDGVGGWIRGEEIPEDSKVEIPK
ncbi:MAG: tetratricopeptide repeat protein [Planctomycetes bacterium]|nr:tetratricopeptide repeat protein [Planctomycetota bacterium]